MQENKLEQGYKEFSTILRCFTSTFTVQLSTQKYTTLEMRIEFSILLNRFNYSEYVELSRARATLQEAVERRGLPAFTDIPAALRCARAVLRGARTHPRHSLGHTILRLKRAYDAAGGKNAKLSRTRAVDVLRDVTRVSRDIVDRCLPPSADFVDFEMFCATVAELAAEAGNFTVCYHL